MTLTQGFWSYAHTDNDNDANRILQLADDVRAAYALKTGEELEFFLDVNRIGWGDKWQAKIDESIIAGDFFIPILTPTYFKRPSCRYELKSYIQKAEKLGYKELILPILYANVAELRQSDPSDELIKILKDFNWENWTELRLESRKSSKYRKAVDRLAERLIRASKENEGKDEIGDSDGEGGSASSKNSKSPQKPSGGGAKSELGDDGELENIVQAEQNMPLWTKTIERLGEKIGDISTIFNEGTHEINESNRKQQGFAGQLKVIREVARKLKQPADEIDQLASEYSTQLYKIDAGMYPLIKKSFAQLEASEDDETRLILETSFKSIRNLDEITQSNSLTLEGLLKNMEPLERQSKYIRNPLRSIRKSLTIVLESSKIVSGWTSFIDRLESGEEE